MKTWTRDIVTKGNYRYHFYFRALLCIMTWQNVFPYLVAKIVLIVQSKKKGHYQNVRTYTKHKIPPKNILCVGGENMKKEATKCVDNPLKKNS
jgi:hypothetical protein